jgi:hypothetical protein
MRDGILWRAGRELEERGRRNSEKAGWLVIPNYAIETGGAPMVTDWLRKRKYVLPDTLLIGAGSCCWREWKLKHHCDVFRKGPVLAKSINAPPMQWQHGVDKPNWYDYLEVEQKSGFGGELCLVQIKPSREADPRPVWLWQSFTELQQHVQFRDPCASFPDGGVCWPVEAFKCRLISYQVLPEFLQIQRNINPWERKSKTGLAPQWEIRTCQDSPFERPRVT